jgi:uncharacterized protein (DUF302 family)
MSDYGYRVEVAEGYDEAVIRTRLALRGEGFSILTEMHVGGKLGAEAGSERQYLIMGAYDAPSSRRSVGTDLQVAVHLPCNVVVQETAEGALVAALDPAESIDASDASMPDAAAAARDALQRVLRRVAEPQ